MIYEGFAMFDKDNNILSERYTKPELAIRDAFFELFEYDTLEEMRSAGITCKKCLFDYDAETRTSTLLKYLDEEIEYPKSKFTKN